MIEILYFEGCPNYEPARELVNEVVAELGTEAEIRHVQIETNEEAIAKRFLGSPSIRVNGIDIEPEARGREEFNLACRIYGTGGVPPRELLVEAIRGA